MQIEKCLCAKEVAEVLGISERSATRLMSAGEIGSFKVRAKLWRTTPSKLSEYKKREFDKYRGDSLGTDKLAA